MPPARPQPPVPPLLPPWVRRAGWALLTAGALAAGVRVLSAPAPPGAPRRLSAGERVEVGRAAAAEEPGWRRASRQHFPGDAWSQDDDFHSLEWRWVREEAARRSVPPTDVFRAIDEDLRAHPPEPPRKASASPAKPRPFYD